MEFHHPLKLAAVAAVVLWIACANLYSQANPSPRTTARNPNKRVAFPAVGPQKTEAARVSILSELIKRRARLVRLQKTLELLACDAEIKRHPAAADGDARALAQRLTGKWRSSRNDYLYRADGSWTVLPEEKGGLHGRWRIFGNQIEITSGYDTIGSPDRYTLILLTDKDYVFTDGQAVFCETRLFP